MRTALTPKLTKNNKLLRMNSQNNPYYNTLYQLNKL